MWQGEMTTFLLLWKWLTCRPRPKSKPCKLPGRSAGHLCEPRGHMLQWHKGKAAAFRHFLVLSPA